MHHDYAVLRKVHNTIYSVCCPGRHIFIGLEHGYEHLCTCMPDLYGHGEDCELSYRYAYNEGLDSDM